MIFPMILFVLVCLRLADELLPNRTAHVYGFAVVVLPTQSADFAHAKAGQCGNQHDSPLRLVQHFQHGLDFRQRVGAPALHWLAAFRQHGLAHRIEVHDASPHGVAERAGHKAFHCQICSNAEVASPLGATLKEQIHYYVETHGYNPEPFEKEFDMANLRRSSCATPQLTPLLFLKSSFTI